ncbi:tol-pal system protein [Actibacterium mucosum KCTC 23349]|uniref:Cell division coordinator CpoB n=1 Tax=Actibacterium mucosum KCTC 23349 TaxID=1454373 RepID=A0A037ZD70_9RHOB|nr:tol-pal system protein [Actibacterium mucosum KCTC 23349]
MLGALAFTAGMLTAPVAMAQDQTLADIRQDLAVLFVEIQRLKTELSTTGAATGPAAGGTALQRIDAIEAQLQRMTARTEDLQFRIDKVVRDGTNRVGDLEFRLCELEPNCDIGSLSDTPTLGGELPTATTVQPQGETTQLAVGEQADFDRAKAVFEQGDAAGAVTMLESFVQTYPVGNLTTEAQFLRGEALKSLGRTSESARAYLEAFSGAPNGTRAPDALFGLGVALNDLGQQREACVTLAEVSARFPGSAADADAQSARATFACN